MAIFSELREILEGLESRIGDVEIDDLLTAMRGLDDATSIDTLDDLATLTNRVERMLTVNAGIIAERSRRAVGYPGLAATHGHRNAVALVQSIVGGTRGDAARAVRLGESLTEAADAVGAGERRAGVLDVEVPGAGEPGAGEPGADGDADEPVTDPRFQMPWHEPLREALFQGRITPAQHDAILRGMGEPPARGGAGSPTEAMIEVWSLATTQLAEEAPAMSAEQLVRRARQMRDTLDPEGVRERFEQSYQARSWRSWRHADGRHHTHIISDDESGAWLDSIRDGALRPRRGGPRFMTDEERTAAADLANDPRTNDQLAYDVFMDILRAGSLANAKDVYGARQPGVRIVTIEGATGARDPFGRMLATGHFEDGGDAVPGTVVDRNMCTVGSRPVTVDGHGNPLDVGRESRLYTSAQRVALAVRDGGCMFPKCLAHASYCEAHHCDHWGEDAGRTDIDRGILLCRHHHMLLHNNGWKITRDGLGPFILHPPGSPRGGDIGNGGGVGNVPSEPIPLTSPSPIRWAWDPPPVRPHWRAAGATHPERQAQPT